MSWLRVVRTSYRIVFEIMNYSVRFRRRVPERQHLHMSIPSTRQSIVVYMYVFYSGIWEISLLQCVLTCLYEAIVLAACLTERISPLNGVKHFIQI